MLLTTEKGTIILGLEVMISDPCYGLGTWCQGVLTNVLPGEYECYVEYSDEGDWGTRVARISVKHKDYLNLMSYDTLEDIEIGVDSGQAGIYDYDYYKQYHTDRNDREHVDEAWYDRVGELTYVLAKNPNYKDFEVDKSDPDYLVKLREYVKNPFISCEYINQLDANIIDGKGFVSSSGYGDGFYECWTTRNKDGQIVLIAIEFLLEDDEEEEDF